MPYDSNLDERLFSKCYENESDRLSVNVYSYNNGAKKLQISRERSGREGDFKFAKLGRMTKEELKAILPLLKEALDHMD